MGFVALFLLFDDFTFLHASDTHSPMAGSEETIQAMKKEKAAFAIVTGDLTEFGDPAAWEKYLGWWKGAPFPVRHGMGNHDATWNCLRTWIGKPNESFDHGGCHFISLDSSTPQDPRPSFGEEELRWLADDLRKLKRDTPVFVYMHHPPEGTEFASVYELDRFFEILEPYNVVAILVGHYHTAWHRVMNGFDVVCGGSTFTKDEAKQPRGWNVCTIKGGTFTIVHKTLAGGTKTLLEKKIAPAARPKILVRMPREDEEIADEIEVQVEVRPEAAEVLANGVKLTKDSVGRWNGRLSTKSLPVGRHFVRITAGEFSKSVPVTIERESGSEVRWRTVLPAAVKTQPRLDGDMLYVGGCDGKVYALRIADGQLQWSFATGAEVTSTPVVTRGVVCFGSADGTVYGVQAGREKWKYAAGAPVYSSPAEKDGVIFVGDNLGRVHAIDAETGAAKWKFEKAGFAIESALSISGDRVYFGAWDEHVYALDTASGRLSWKCKASGVENAKAAKRYYSPGDGVPAIVGTRVLIADRGYRLSIIEDGKLVGEQETSGAVVASRDGKAYVKRTDGALEKVDATGASIWTAKCETGLAPTMPAEGGSAVFVVSSTGLVTAVDAASGKILWQRRATPQLYVLASPAARAHVVYVAGMDGSVTAIGSRP